MGVLRMLVGGLILALVLLGAFIAALQLTIMAARKRSSGRSWFGNIRVSELLSLRRRVPLQPGTFFGVYFAITGCAMIVRLFHEIPDWEWLGILGGAAGIASCMSQLRYFASLSPRPEQHGPKSPTMGLD